MSTNAQQGFVSLEDDAAKGGSVAPLAVTLAV
jgi:hypothetical protein